MQSRTPFTIGIVIGVLVMAALSVAVFLMLKPSGNIVYIDSDSVIEGDYSIPSDQTVLIRNNSALIVNGNLDVDGAIVSPEDSEDGFSLVVSGDVNISPDSELMSNGSIQIVDDASKLARSEEDINRLFDSVEEKEEGIQLGPLTDSTQNIVASNLVIPKSPANKLVRRIGLLLRDSVASSAKAQAPSSPRTVVIGGKVIVGGGEKPPKDIDVSDITRKKKFKKVVLNFDFGTDTGVALQNLTISGPAGTAGSDETGSCNVTGGDGSDALRFNVRAHNLTINNFTLNLADGGPGGSATTSTDCDPAIAKGGSGGKPGNFRMIATGSFNIQGSFKIVPGKGGPGGMAVAVGKAGATGCPGEKGGDATATGGQGGDSAQNLSAAGSISGLGNVTVEQAVAGRGGDATATGGQGGDGGECGCAGGPGGNATANAGNGGDASVSGPNATKGGDGGNASATPGTGGNGGSCGVNEGPGGNGGKGGDAQAEKGAAGQGKSAGSEGSVLSSRGGNGGNGGDGCNEGQGGPEGSGDPENGQPGEKGNKTCVIEKVKNVSVIQFGGTYLPTSQLRKAGADACPEEHWHGSNVIGADGVIYNDPNPGACGFGMVSSTPEMNLDTSTIDTEIVALELSGQALDSYFDVFVRLPGHTGESYKESLLQGDQNGGAMHETSIPPLVIPSI